LIRKCGREDEETIFRVINGSAKAYRGVIPEDRYREPYMPLEELRGEMSEITFFGYEEEGRLLGVAGYQPVKDVTLVRHLYVLPEHQGRGIGSELLSHIMRTATTLRVLVGTWEAAEWAVRFYEKHGFKLLSNKDELLRKYWKIPERQIELSVVLGIEKSGRATANPMDFRL
jgi:GNAT superfamily N-acetyltransferase